MHNPQRGAAALPLTVLLVFALLLVIASTKRQIVTEVRASANGQRAEQAFEAAEAGVEWALARLNDDAPIDTFCQPSADRAARSFRDTRLRRSGPLDRLAPTTWHDGTAEVAPVAACARGAGGWECSCPVASPPTLAVAGGGATTPSFNVRIEPGGAAGAWRLVAHGCLRVDAACTATTDGSHEAAARIEVQIALLSALRRPPPAALVAGGDVDVGTAALQIENRDGVAAWLGGQLRSSAVSLVAPAGSGPGDSVAAGDAQLAALDADRFFARSFGMGRNAWFSQPAAARVDCSRDCAARLTAAVGSGSRIVAIDGDVDLQGPLTLGNAVRPVVLAATGDVRLRGDIVVHGVVYAASLDWRDAGAAATLRGALLVQRSLTGDAPAAIVRDPAVLAALQRETGSIVRIDGSWKDF